jgi:hypothetical protein
MRRARAFAFGGFGALNDDVDMRGATDLRATCKVLRDVALDAGRALVSRSPLAQGSRTPASTTQWRGATVA